MKVCTVDIERAQELCPDPRIFNACTHALSMCYTKEEIKNKLEEWNKFCELRNCPYLKEQQK